MAWIELHQGLREHKKVFACADILGISRVTMIGTLASIWLWALDNAQDGVLNGVSNRTVARVCDWPEKKADKLVSALLETGWLDKNGEKLVIHDWSDYAGRLMERREKDRERKKNGKGNRKISTGIPPEPTRNSCATVPNRTVPNQSYTTGGTNPEGVIGAATDEASSPDGSKPPVPPKAPSGFDGQSFSSFWSSYPDGPGKISRESAYAAWKALAPSRETAAKILSSLEVWKKSSRWLDNGGEFVPSAANFLAKGYWKVTLPPPSASRTDIPKGASGELGQAELEAIQRVLREEVPE